MQEITKAESCYFCYHKITINEQEVLHMDKHQICARCFNKLIMLGLIKETEENK